PSSKTTSASVTSRSGPFSRATKCTCIALLIVIALSSAPSCVAGAPSAEPSRVLALTTSFDLPPGSKSHPGGGEGLERRRPKAHLRPWRRRGLGDEQACQPKRSAGHPEGVGAPAEVPRASRSTRATSETASADARAAARPRGASTCACGEA